MKIDKSSPLFQAIFAAALPWINFLALHLDDENDRRGRMFLFGLLTSAILFALLTCPGIFGPA
jgi:hypothetical protein